jgi:hypothetical protein
MSKDTMTKDPEKTVDLPPHGSRNPDPLTDSPGSHPIETGVGAVLGGAASGLAVGALASGPAAPIGAVIGAIAGGAVAGGLAGKGVGELIDPTTEDNWIRDLMKGHPKQTAEWEAEAREAYRWGWRSEGRFPRQTFAQAEARLEDEWKAQHPAGTWAANRSHVRDGYEKGRELNGTRQEVG